MYHILLIGSFILLMVALLVYRGELLSPCVLLYAYSLFAVAFGYFRYELWDLERYGAYAMALYLLGMACFGVGAFLSDRLSKTRKRQNRTYPTNTDSIARKEIPGYILFFCVLVSLVMLGYFYTSMRSFIASKGYGDRGIGFAIQYNRLFNEDDEIPQMIGLLGYFREGCSFILFGVFLYNTMIGKRRFRDFFLLVPAGIYFVDALLRSSRGDIIQFAIGAITLWYILYHNIKGWRGKSDLKFARKILKIGLVAVPLFILSAVATGRYTNLGDMDIVNYITIYISGGVRAFDVFLKEVVPSPKVWGEETFVSLHNFIHALTGKGELMYRFLEFSSIRGTNIGNIYTSFRRFYYDFGVIGVAVLSFIQGAVSSWVYGKISRRIENGVTFWTMFYAFFAYTVMYVVIDELFFSSLVSFVGFKRIVTLIFAYKFVNFNKIHYHRVRVVYRQ